MLKKDSQIKSFLIMCIIFTIFLFGCSSHRVCSNDLKKKCSHCNGTGKYEYQTDLHGIHSSIMKCHVCKGQGFVCLRR